MQAIILAGGFGTRLQSVVKNIPKPMAPIHNKPFLAYLIAYLKSQEITSVILSVHYLREQIEAFFKDEYLGVKISYAIEEEPLGTGGAIVHALKNADLSEAIFVLNGDTFLKLDYRAMFAKHQQALSMLTMALRKISDCSRYGAVLTQDDTVVAFNEKGQKSAGFINAGVYLINPHLFQKFLISVKQFSFEKDFLFPNIDQLKPQGFIVEDYFIDIGIPEDYARAVNDFDPFKC